MNHKFLQKAIYLKRSFNKSNNLFIKEKLKQLLNDQGL
ncbi:hypothetical protein DAT561_p1030 (plasmid) [Melissococcus plutonius]|uniref:Uncharacterized protein n=1 Tax=Melissococcus plutonius TaxID=33970 RepID=A0A2Z5Y4R1_9ENTE|nr:hypothetical protein DAT561_p1030 [Melissococcus plutonius]